MDESFEIDGPELEVTEEEVHTTEADAEKGEGKKMEMRYLQF